MLISIKRSSLRKIIVISMYKAGPVYPGLRALEAIARTYGDYVGTIAVRQGEILPDLADFDVLLSSGGPGDPTELGDWGQAYADLIGQIRLHNRNHPTQPKRAFLICHSFQVMSHVWDLGRVSRRSVALWGVQPQIPDELPASVTPVFPTDTFYALESRFYQVLPTDDVTDKCTELGLVIAARDEAGAMTAWQSVDGHLAAVQFHPEAKASDVQNLMANPPVGDNEPIHMCPPQMRDDTRERLNLLPMMEQILIDFITKEV